MTCLDLFEACFETSCKCTRRPHGNMIFEVLAPCILIIFFDFLIVPHVNFASFWDLFLKPFWIVLGSTFGALGGRQVANTSSEIDAKIGIGKSVFRGDLEAFLGWWQEGKGGGKPPPWGQEVRKKGRKEKREKGRKKEERMEGKWNGGMVLHARLGGSAD